jgi:hypothetical protein
MKMAATQLKMLQHFYRANHKPCHPSLETVSQEVQSTSIGFIGINSTDLPSATLTKSFASSSSHCGGAI